MPAVQTARIEKGNLKNQEVKKKCPIHPYRTVGIKSKEEL